MTICKLLKKLPKEKVVAIAAIIVLYIMIVATAIHHDEYDFKKLHNYHLLQLC